jgi:hypothetical protein
MPAPIFDSASVVEKVLEVGPPFDNRTRSFLQVSLYPLKKRRSDPDPSALFQSDFVHNVPQLRVPFQNRVDLLSEASVLVPQLAPYRTLLRHFRRRARDLVISFRTPE